MTCGGKAGPVERRAWAGTTGRAASWTAERGRTRPPRRRGCRRSPPTARSSTSSGVRVCAGGQRPRRSPERRRPSKRSPTRPSSSAARPRRPRSPDGPCVRERCPAAVVDRTNQSAAETSGSGAGSCPVVPHGRVAGRRRVRGTPATRRCGRRQLRGGAGDQQRGHQAEERHWSGPKRAACGPGGPGGPTGCAGRSRRRRRRGGRVAGGHDRDERRELLGRQVALDDPQHRLRRGGLGGLASRSSLTAGCSRASWAAASRAWCAAGAAP